MVISAASYQDDGSDLQTAWRDASYDDAQWKTGAGVFQTANTQYPPQNAGGLTGAGEGLYAYWPLDEASGNDVTNLVEGGAAGRLQRGPFWSIDNERGIAVQFDGQNDYMDAGTLPALSVSDNFTWSFWFRAKSVENADGVIAGNRNDGTTDPAQFIRFSPTKFEYVSGTADPAIPYEVQVDQWAHFAVVKSGPKLTYYVNGVSVR